jgi:hypothetical protein
MSGTIKVLVDEQQPIASRGVSPIAGALNQTISAVTELNKDLLRKNISAFLRDMQHILGETHLDINEFWIEDVSFTLTIGKAAEISLISITRGSLTADTGITFHLRRKQMNGS